MGDVLCDAQRQISLTKWLCSTAYLTLAECPGKRIWESDSRYLWGLGMPRVLVLYLFVLYKIRDGAGNYPGRGTEGCSGHTCSSYGDKRIFFEVGLLLWVLLETTLVTDYCSFVKVPSTQDPGIIFDYQNC